LYISLITLAFPLQLATEVIQVPQNICQEARSHTQLEFSVQLTGSALSITKALISSKTDSVAEPYLC
jgi:hypothetical protein